MDATNMLFVVSHHLLFCCVCITLFVVTQKARERVYGPATEQATKETK